MRDGERNGVFALSPLGVGHTTLLFVYPDARADDPVIQVVVDGVRALWPEALAAH